MIIWIIGFWILVFLLYWASQKETNYHHIQKDYRDPFTISDDWKIEYMRNIENKEIENTYSRLTTLEKYKNNMNSERILMKEEEIECSRKIQDGDKLALERLVLSNIRNVIEAVESINKHGLHPDLIEIGNKGLIEAAELYNGKIQFRKFADKFIRGNIQNEINLNNEEYTRPYIDPDLRPKHRVCLTCMNRNRN